MSKPRDDGWLERFSGTSSGKTAIAALMDFIQGCEKDDPTGSWNSILLREQVLGACWSAFEYRDLIALDPNEAERKAYLQGRASFDDVQRAADTILDFLGIYPDTARILRDGCQKEGVPDSLRDDDPSIVLSELLIGLQTGIAAFGEPSHSGEPHHCILGALQLPKPVTLANRRPDPVFTSLAFEIEARLRAFVSGANFTVGSTMPEGDDYYAIYRSHLSFSLRSLAQPAEDPVALVA